MKSGKTDESGKAIEELETDGRAGKLVKTGRKTDGELESR